MLGTVESQQYEYLIHDQAAMASDAAQRSAGAQGKRACGDVPIMT
ncbi:MAG: hypothetical protein ACYS9X_03365 [Planctomycetota bacterium]|jgi:hypothetical protein